MLQSSRLLRRAAVAAVGSMTTTTTTTTTTMTLTTTSMTIMRQWQRAFSVATSATETAGGGGGGLSNLNVTLYQYNICPFCHKTKAVMAYAGITPTIVEVNPLSKAELKQTPDQTYRKVPIAVFQYNDNKDDDNKKQVNGSDEIVNELLQMESVKKIILSKSTSFKGGWDDFYPNSNNTASSSSSQQQSWITFANDDLAALLYPNICSTLSDSYTAFGYVNQVDTFSSMQKISIRSIGSLAMYMAASRIKKKRGIVDERAALQAALQKFQVEGLKKGGIHQQFVSGMDDPSLADLVVYGTLRSVEGLPTHHQVIMEDPDNDTLKEWYLRVKGRLLDY